MFKNILITGAAGFIGFHLCKKLLNSEYSVIGIDNINENLAASSLEKPRNNAPVIAVPDLEAPDIRLNVWEKPIITACNHFISEFLRFPLQNLSVKKSNAAKIILLIAILSRVHL